MLDVSIEVMNLVWKSPLPTTEKMVLLVIADHADDDGGNSWPSIGTIAKKASISSRSAQRYIARLADSGWITIRSQQGGTKEMRDDRRPNLYAINLERLNGVTAETPRNGMTAAGHGVTDRASRGDNSNSHGVTPMSPKPSLEPYIEPPSSSSLAESNDKPERTGSLLPDVARQDNTQPVNASTVTAHYVDTFRARHGNAPVQQSIKRIAQAAKQVLAEGHPPDLVMRAAAEAAAGGHANLASSITWLMANGRNEPKSYNAIRTWLEGKS